MRKGFTLVELAVVLVIIGLIMGMAIKGKSLIDIARVRASVSKLKKFEAAVAVSVSRRGEIPRGADGTDGTTTAGFIPFSLFLDYGLTDSDARENYTGDGWGFFRCRVSSTVNDYWVSDSMVKGGHTILDNDVKLCATTVDATNIVDLSATGVASKTMSARLACYIEVLLDDENIATGFGRTWNQLINDTPTTKAYYADCANFPEATRYPYAFLIF